VFFYELVNHCFVLQLLKTVITCGMILGGQIGWLLGRVKIWLINTIKMSVMKSTRKY